MEDEKCSIEKCDIFDFMSSYVGLTVLHPGGFSATQKLADTCHIDKNTNVVDIACGRGTSAVYLAQKYGCRVTGIDISEDSVEYASDLARRKGLESKVSFRLGNALDMPFSDNEFDVAISQAILVLVSDKKKAVQEALRVTKAGGRVGWIELSWKKQVPEEFLEAISNVICAYCMLNVHTFEDWEKLFRETGVKQLELISCSMEFNGIRGMLADEGFLNSCKVMFRYLINPRVRKRMDTMDRFFKNNIQYIGFGIYTGKK